MHTQQARYDGDIARPEMEERGRPDPYFVLRFRSNPRHIDVLCVLAGFRASLGKQSAAI